jgi:riboflavin synthase alpha subunit
MPYLSLLTTAQKMGGHFIHGEIYLVQGILYEQKEN